MSTNRTSTRSSNRISGTANPWIDSGCRTPESVDVAAAVATAAVVTAAVVTATIPAAGSAAPLPARPQLVFRRTVHGDAQVRDSRHPLPLHMARLLLLFEGPQSIDDLRRMIDEAWLPEALIELERRRMIERVRGEVADGGPQVNAAAADAPLRRPGSTPFEGQRDRVRIQFLRQLGALGAEMGRRIDRCRSLDELDDLMPQVEALVEAIAGRDALARFRAQTIRDH